MKKFSFLSILCVIIFLSIIINLKKTPYYYKTFKVIDTFLPTFVSSTLRMMANNKINSKKIKNDYNEKFLPDTQFNKMEFKKIPLKFINISEIGYLNIIKRKTFYMDFYKDNIVIMPKKGVFYYKNMDNLEDIKIKFQKINSNLDASFVLDLLIFNKSIYVSYVKKEKNCAYLKLAKSDMRLSNLIFEDIFSSNDCMQLIQAGRIQKIFKEDIPHILLSTQSHTFEKENERDYKPQDDNSIYGKIISINEEDKTYSIFSKGHRNILGLHVVNKETILSTENGPRGGDEINRIFEGKNYGWDIASVGKKYYLDEKYKDHKQFGFQEPIFSFIPSIGISEIIKIDNNFDEDWQNNYLIATMDYNHLLRVNFNDDFNKINYYEKILIGERMRDLKYYMKNSYILIALEDTGSIGLLKNIKGQSQKRLKK